MPKTEERIYIRQASELLGREMGTIRKWEAEGVLPDELVSHRGERNWRYWTPDQIEGIRKWIDKTDRRPGKGLPHYSPDEEKVEETLHKLRRPRKATILDWERRGKLPRRLHHHIDGRGLPAWTDEQLDEITEIMRAQREAEALEKKAKAAMKKSSK